MTNSLELRCLTSSELRTAGTGRLVGYAAVFNQLSEPLQGFREKIRNGAFARAIAGRADVRALLNHDPNLVLGRTDAGTLSLQEDRHGLKYTVDLPDNTLGRDLFVSVSRGDITQSSFGFVAKQDQWTKGPDGGQIRELIDVDLFDVSPVTFPAYPQTSVGLRGKVLGWYSGGGVIPQTEVTETDRQRLKLMLRLAQML